jgi:hypothetical protein
VWLIRHCRSFHSRILRKSSCSSRSSGTVAARTDRVSIKQRSVSSAQAYRFLVTLSESVSMGSPILWKVARGDALQ